MKKLKKVLSLVLVLAMALSVFGVCASATNIEDYADKSEITYTKAVGVLSGLGVLEGSEKDGVSSFKPLDTMNRAEAAKIATYLIGVQDKVVDATTFTDVEGWAKSYIAIAQSQGLINGRNATTYDPAGTLTGYEWEKIVLCALGYDAEIEGLVGATWQGSTAVLAGKVGLLEGMNSDYDATKAITREQAALIAYNALYAKTVLYPYTINKIATFGDKTLGELVFGLKAATTEFDVFGAPVKDVISSTKIKEVYAVAYEAVETYNNIAAGTKVSDIEDDIADAVGKKSVTADVYVDGVKATNKPATVGGLGVDVAAYALSDGTYRIVVINTYVEVLAKTAYTAEKTNSNGTVTAEAFYTLKNSGKNATLAAEGFKDGDIVVYNVGDEANLNKAQKTVAVNAEAKTGVKGYATTVSFDGTVAKAKAGTGYIKIDDGDATYFDKNTVYAADVGGRIVKKNAANVNTGYYSYVYDKYGNIIYVAAAKRDLVSEVGHLYVINTISYYNDNLETDVDNLYYPVLNPQANAQALVILYSGNEASVEVVDLAITQTIDGKFAYLNAYGEASSDKVAVGLTGTKKEAFAEYYVTEDGKYILDYDCADKDSTITTAKGNKTITLSNGTKIATVDTAITYLSATIDPYTVDHLTAKNIVDVAKSVEVKAETVTGYGNFKAASAAPGYIEVGRDGKATVGAIMNGVTNVEDKAVTALFTGIEAKDTAAGDVYNFVGLDGTEYQLSTVAAADQDTVADGATKCTATEGTFGEADVNTLYTLYRNSDGDIVGYAAAATSTETVNVSYVTWTGSYGYVEGTPVTGDASGIERIDIASTFAGLVYDETIEDTKAVAEAKGDTVVLYKNSKGEIIFGRTVEATTETYTVSSQWVHGYVYTFVNDKTSVKDSKAAAAEYAVIADAFNGEFTFGSNVITNALVQSLAKDAAGDAVEITDTTETIATPFVLTIAKTTYADGTADYALVSAQQAQ
jgi:hypothetical protein